MVHFCKASNSVSQVPQVQHCNSPIREPQFFLICECAVPSTCMPNYLAQISIFLDQAKKVFPACFSCSVESTDNFFVLNKLYSEPSSKTFIAKFLEFFADILSTADSAVQNRFFLWSMMSHH